MIEAPTRRRACCHFISCASKLESARGNEEMNWLLKRLGYRDGGYLENDFSLHIEPIMRGVISVVYTRHGANLNLSGERIGGKWEGIERLSRRKCPNSSVTSKLHLKRWGTAM
jgi:hypothetical protein